MNYTKYLITLYLFLLISNNSYSMISKNNDYDNVPPLTISNIEVINNCNNKIFTNIDIKEKEPRVVINNLNNNKTNDTVISKNKYNNNQENLKSNNDNLVTNNILKSEAYKLLELRKKAYQASSGQYVQVNEEDKNLFNMIKSKIKPCKINNINQYKLNNKENTTVRTSNIHTIHNTNTVLRSNNNLRHNRVKNINSIYVCA